MLAKGSICVSLLLVVVVTVAVCVTFYAVKSSEAEEKEIINSDIGHICVYFGPEPPQGYWQIFLAKVCLQTMNK